MSPLCKASEFSLKIEKSGHKEQESLGEDGDAFASDLETHTAETPKVLDEFLHAN